LNSALTWLWGRLPINARARSAIMWLLSPKFTVVVSGLVVNEDGLILLLRHTYRGKRPWGLPGGGLKHGESLEECLLREVHEETGMNVEILHMLSGAAHPDRWLVDVIYSCRPLPGETLDVFRPNAEIAEAHWFDCDDLPADVSKGQHRLIKIALEQARELET